MINPEYLDEIEFQSNDLATTAKWREQVARRHPNDRRNKWAIEHIAALSAEFAELEAKHRTTGETMPAVYELRRQLALLGDDAMLSYVEASNELRSGIGFHCFPKTVAAYIGELLNLARIFRSGQGGAA